MREPDPPCAFFLEAKQIYASHYFRAALDLSALLDAPAGESGFYLLDLYRVRIDPPTGIGPGQDPGPDRARGGREAEKRQGPSRSELRGDRTAA